MIGPAPTAQRSNFPCQPHDVETIRPVRGYVDIQDPVIKIESLFQRDSQGKVGVKEHNTSPFFAQGQLLFGAEHAFRYYALKRG